MQMTEANATDVDDWKPFPYDQFPDPVKEYIRQAAMSLHCEPSMVGLPMLSSLATAIGNSIIIQPKRGWTEPAVVWSAVVAPSGSMKSPAVKAGTRFVQDQQQRQAEAYRLAMQDYDNAYVVWETENPKRSKNRQPPPEEPTHARCLVSDATVEALVEVLHVNPRGVLCFRDELSGLFGSFGQYKASASPDVASFLSMFNAGDIINDRKVNKTVRIVSHAAVSITGGIQPDILRRSLAGENTENGLAARFLLCEPPITPKQWVDDEVDPKLLADVGTLFQGLFGIECQQHPTKCYLSQQALARFVRFVNRHGIDTTNAKGDVQAAFSKLEAYCLRFALLFHTVDLVEGRAINTESRVQLENMERAIALVEWCKWQTRRVYQSMQGIDQDKSELLKLIREQFPDGISSEDLRRAKSKYRAAGAASDALEELQRLKLGRFHDINTGGRPKTVFKLKKC